MLHWAINLPSTSFSFKLFCFHFLLAWLLWAYSRGVLLFFILTQFHLWTNSAFTLHFHKKCNFSTLCASKPKYAGFISMQLCLMKINLLFDYFLINISFPPVQKQLLAMPCRWRVFPNRCATMAFSRAFYCLFNRAINFWICVFFPLCACGAAWLHWWTDCKENFSSVLS